MRKKTVKLMTVKLMPFNIIHSFAQLNGSKYCYIILIVQFNIHLFLHS